MLSKASVGMQLALSVACIVLLMLSVVWASLIGLSGVSAALEHVLNRSLPAIDFWIGQIAIYSSYSSLNARCLALVLGRLHIRARLCGGIVRK